MIFELDLPKENQLFSFPNYLSLQCTEKGAVLA